MSNARCGVPGSAKVRPPEASPLFRIEYDDARLNAASNPDAPSVHRVHARV